LPGYFVDEDLHHRREIERLVLSIPLCARHLEHGRSRLNSVKTGSNRTAVEPTASRFRAGGIFVLDVRFFGVGNAVTKKTGLAGECASQL
jgi:hypothetical protein